LNSAAIFSILTITLLSDTG